MKKFKKQPVQNRENAEKAPRRIIIFVRQWLRQAPGALLHQVRALQQDSGPLND